LAKKRTSHNPHGSQQRGTGKKITTIHAGIVVNLFRLPTFKPRPRMFWPRIARIITDGSEHVRNPPRNGRRKEAEIKSWLRSLNPPDLGFLATKRHKKAQKRPVHLATDPTVPIVHFRASSWQNGLAELIRAHPCNQWQKNPAPEIRRVADDVRRPGSEPIRAFTRLWRASPCNQWLKKLRCLGSGNPGH
jgi:hypothetical protein